MTGRTLRFVNFLLDTTIYLVVTLSIIFVFRNVVERDMVKWISVCFYVLYYFLFEYFTSQTLGKMITHSKVVQLHTDNKRYFIQILGRTLMRIIPLDVLSYLFFNRGLHDWISKTDVRNIRNKPNVSH